MSDAPHDQTAASVPMPALLQQAKDRVLEQLHERLEGDGFGGIRFRHGSVFRFIDEAGSRLTDMAERSGLSKQAVGETIAELHGGGYVEGVPDPGDGRVKIIRLTQRGIEAKAAATRILKDVEDSWARLLGEDRVATLRQTLEDIASLQDFLV